MSPSNEKPHFYQEFSYARGICPVQKRLWFSGDITRQFPNTKPRFVVKINIHILQQKWLGVPCFYTGNYIFFTIIFYKNFTFFAKFCNFFMFFSKPPLSKRQNFGNLAEKIVKKYSFCQQNPPSLPYGPPATKKSISSTVKSSNFWCGV